MSYSVRRYFVDEFHFRHVPSLKGRVLDIGGKKVRKRGQFDVSKYNLRVEYANLDPKTEPDYCCDATNIPVPDATFDAAVCSEVLEHVPSPEAVLQEAHRVLKPGGTLLLCVPFLHRIHADPHDFARYTDYYWRTLLEGIGLRDVHIERQGLFFSVLVDFLKQFASQSIWPRRTQVRPLFHWAVAYAQRWALQMERRPEVQTHPFFRSFMTGFGITATKGG